MPTEAKPLFRSDALRPKLAGFTIPPEIATARQKLASWTKLLASKRADSMKETELLADFITDVFVSVLGYTGPASGGSTYTLKREALIQVDGKFADGGLGRFSTAGEDSVFVAVLEGKGPRDPLDRPFAGRKRSAIDQALHYAVNLPCNWYIVTNLRETRLYHKGHDQFTFERFETAALASDDAALRKFVFLLGAERVVHPSGRCHLDDLLAESRRVGQELTRDYYREYAELRRHTFEQLRKHNPGERPADLITATQAILDRILFIAFCEDRDLLPANSIARAYRHADPYNPRPIWENFRGLFRAVDEGSPHLEIDQYNGGLFARDELLERLNVPDAVCKGFDKLAAYDYSLPTAADDAAEDTAAKLIDVEILGHIFEQSISDLEELHKEIAEGPEAEPAKEGPSRRKKEGAFYTPSFVTRYIVAETLKPVLAERFETLRLEHQQQAARGVRKVLDDPRAYDVAALRPAQQTALVAFWEAWQDTLAAVRIVDPACGSGAFLIEAFEQLYDVYRQSIAHLTELRGPFLFEIDRQILRNNLYGVDLNEEAVEICRLSLWIKTAQRGKVLTSLDHNVKVGNSVVADTAVHPRAFDWGSAFPEAFAGGGFDVVIGNPPYVRQEWIAAYKPYLQQHYRAFDGVADLYVYFYELGLNLLKPGGRLGFVVTNKWMKAGYGEALRRLFGESSWVESVVDFGHAKQIFPDADVFPSILVVRKPTEGPAPSVCRVCAIPREQLRVDDLSRQIETQGFAVPRAQLGAAPWTLDHSDESVLLEKLRRRGTPLKQFIGSAPYRGILTGFNAAFLIDTPTKDRLVTSDPKSAELFKPYLRGQDVQRWQAEWNGLWMLALKSSANHPWPWKTAGEKAEAVFAETYPAIYAHLNQYRDALVKRQDQGEHWWELRSCAYWEKFDRPKILYQDIAWQPRFCLDTLGTLSNNTVYFLATDDPWVLAALNAPLSWWFAWRKAQHGKDEALRFFTAFLETFPVPEPLAGQREQAGIAVRRLKELATASFEGRRAFLDWLRVEYAIEKASQKLQDPVTLDTDVLVAEVKRLRGKKNPLTVAGLKALKDEQTRSIAPLQVQTAEVQSLESRIADLVNAAYGLTVDEVALMWRTAPPRTPGRRSSTTG